MAKIGDLYEAKNELTIHWKFKDFFSLPNDKDLFYYSPRFYFSGTSWELMMYPNGETSNNSEGWLGLYLMRQSFGSPITLNFTFGLRTADDRIEHTVNFAYEFKIKGFGYGVAKFIRRSVLLEKKSELTPSNILTAICILKNSEQNSITGSLFRRLQDVSDNLSDIYRNGKRSDLSLKLNEGSLQAHRIILETRSPVFAAMFSHDTKENQTGEICINDIDKNTFQAILIYLYSGDIEGVTTQNALSIYDAAEKYDIKEVKEMCLKFITLNLSEEWVCDVIKFAELYGEEELGQLARDYFKKNAGKILETENWKTFAKENHDTGVELLASLVRDLLPK